MALKRKIDKAKFESLSDELKFEYKKAGEDEYVLQTEGDEDTGALKRAKEREATARREADERADGLQTQLDELNATRGRKDRDLDSLTKSYDKKLDDQKLDYEGKLSKRDGYIAKTLVDGATKELARGLSSKHAKLLEPHIASRISADLTGDEPVIRILGADGKASALKMDDLRAEFVANKDFAGIIDGSKASGGAGNAPAKPNGGAVNNPGDNPPNFATMNPAAMVEHLKSQKQA